MITSRKQIDEHRSKRRFVEAYIPPLNDTCRFRSMLAAEQFAIADQAAKMKADVRVMAIIATWCNEDGLLMYQWDSEEDVAEINELDGKIVDTLYDVVNTHCANLEPVEKMIKAAGKNSVADRGELQPTA